MKTHQRIFFALALGLTLSASAAEAGWSVGVRFGFPGWYGPYYGCCPHYWYPPPAYVVAPPPPVSWRRRLSSQPIHRRSP